MCVWEDFRVRGSQSLDPWQGAVSPPSPRDGLWIWVPHGGGQEGHQDVKALLDGTSVCVRVSDVVCVSVSVWGVWGSVLGGIHF